MIHGIRQSQYQINLRILRSVSCGMQNLDDSLGGVLLSVSFVVDSVVDNDDVVDNDVVVVVVGSKI